ncbi:MAG: amidohydrolase family protein [Enterobacterales bacterium]|nr:amidohydrolase family protein [Enterobacterales bacterium]
MATTLFKLTPLEALQGVTINAAKALNKDQRIGRKQADLALWDLTSPAELSYGIGSNACSMVIKQGKVIVDKRSSE